MSIRNWQERKEVMNNLERRLASIEKSMSTMVTQNSQAQRSLQNQVRSGVKLAQRAGQRSIHPDQNQNQKKEAGRRASTGQIEQRKALQPQPEVKQILDGRQEAKQDVGQQQQGSAAQRLDDDAMDVDLEPSQQKKDVQGSGKAVNNIEERRKRTLIFKGLTKVDTHSVTSFLAERRVFAQEEIESTYSKQLG